MASIESGLQSHVDYIHIKSITSSN